MDEIRSRIESALSGSYSLQRELGGGGMSRTFLATESALGRQVVIKVLAPELLAGISVERFRREILMAARLQHPHVVPVLTTGETDGIPWFTMPYVDGESLRQRLASGPLGIGETLGFLRDVARALAYAHSNGIVHRDIKPDNVLVSSRSATVTDFGIAKAISAARTSDGEMSSTLTQAGTAIGTPAYMSPEQVLGEAVDHRTDIYSFGVMTYELLAGRTPFSAESSAKLIAAHLTELPRDIADVRSDCPPQLAQLVMQCMAKDASERPQTAAELIRVLDAVTTEESLATVASGAHSDGVRPRNALALLCLATAAVALVAWVATRALGLPDWVLPGALGVMLLGVPVILFTAFVQRAAERSSGSRSSSSQADASRPPGMLARAVLKASPHITWRRTWMGGVVAVGAFVAVVAGYMALRAQGIGPMGTLQARGDFDVRETLIVADFRSPADDPELGSTIAEALRTDLAQSQMLTVLTRGSLQELLTLMQRPDEKVVHFDLAREIATREGAKAVLDGEVMRVGERYVLSARLVSATDGTELARFRREVRNENDLLPELGRLSRAVRERAGESLRDIRASNHLERVTTSSLPALRKYVEGSRAHVDEGDSERALELLGEAVALDTAFAMAWRAMATALSSRVTFERNRQMEYVSTAYRHRDRLTLPERLLTEATYFTVGPRPDVARALEAYDRLIRVDSTNVSALNNAASVLMVQSEHERAERYLRRAVALPSVTATAYHNLVRAQVFNRRSVASIDSTLADYHAHFPQSLSIDLTEMLAAWTMGRYERLDSIAQAGYQQTRSLDVRIMSAWALGELAAVRGQPEEALRWYALYTQEAYPADQPLLRAVSAVMDSISYHGILLGDVERARRDLRRLLDRTPMEELPLADRPWYSLMHASAELLDSTLAQAVVPRYLRDVPGQESDSLGARSRIMAQVMHASGRWNEAIRLFHEARQANSVHLNSYPRLVGTAHDAAGRPDSAIVWFERYIGEPDPDMSSGSYLPRVHRRLGELYEQRGDVEQAMAHYSMFIDYWRDAEPVLQPEVEEVRRRVQRMSERSG